MSQVQPPPQPQQHGGALQHIMQQGGPGPMAQGQFRGTSPQMSPTPRPAPNPGKPQQLRHPGLNSLPGMDQIPRYQGIPPTRPGGNQMGQMNMMQQQQSIPQQG